ncbi:MAG: AAA family ATPase [Candidatus Eisenbacteria bacterium]|nr:AAA family ATPase [Candidatus Latescibacterota bacterium]MBD3302970.1 AAA family ATPase [Candidatus Eisenbacteria bacterium]
MGRSHREEPSLTVVCTGRPGAPPLQRPEARTIAVVSGKGGVGKTTLAANLAIAVRRRQHPVLLVDGDWGMANVDLQLWLSPQHTLHHVLTGEKGIEEIVLTADSGVRVLPGASGVEEMANLDEVRCERLLCSISETVDRRDLILVDTPSGINRIALHLARAADEVIVVTTPEPSSLADAYASLKLVADPPGGTRPWIVVNRAADSGEGREAYERIREVSRSFLSVEPALLGIVLEDPRVGSAIRSRMPILKLYPRSTGSKCIDQLASRLLDTHEPEPLESEDPQRPRKIANLEDAPA